MKAVSLNEIKRELNSLEGKAIQDLCMRLAKYKKENKELLSYLLFEAHDEQAYTSMVKAEIEELFEGLPSSNVYLIKKSLRRVLRITNKQIKYSGNPGTEVELRVYFCTKIISAGIPLAKSQVLTNLFHQQVKKIEAALAKLPEDLQFDYHNDLEALKAK